MPAVPEPLRRQPRLRRRRRPLRQRRRRRELQLRRLGPGRQPAQPVRRPARRRRRDAGAADGEGARCEARTSARAPTRSASTARSSASTRRLAPACPTTRTRSARPERARIIAYGLRNPFRITVRPGTSEVWIGDVGWNTWEEINRIVAPTDGPSRTSAGPATRAARARAATTARTSTSARTSTPPVRPRSRRPTTPGTTARRSCRTRPARPGARPPRGAFYTGGSYPGYTGSSSSPTTRATASGRCGPGERPAEPGHDRDVRGRRGQPGRHPDRPGGDLFYVDFDGGTIRRIGFAGANTPPVAVVSANPTSGIAPLTVSFSGTGSSTRRRRAHVRLGSRRTAPSTTLGDVVHLRSRGRTTCSCASPTRRRLRHRRGDDHGEQLTSATIGTPTAGTTWRVGNTSRSPARRPTRSRRAAHPRSAGRSSSTTARRTATPTRCRTSSASRAARSWLPTTSTRPTSSCGSP